ncbi:MAG: type II secretion system F family protein [Hyphomicrobiaceae bacterium]|nr:type II secretion system F family protein [Hyphomicrobiaceae bacterium]
MTEILDHIGSLELSPPVAIGGLVFVTVLLMLLGVMHISERRRAVRRRAVAYNPAAGTAPEAFDTDAERLYAIERAFQEGRRDKMSEARAEMVRAGWFDADAVANYYGARLIFGFGFGIAAATILLHLRPGAEAFQIAAIAAAGAAIGAFIPRLIVDARQKAMLRQCERGFPDFLDLLVICAEAGVPPRAAIERVCREIVRGYPFLGANLFLMHLQIRAGRSMAETLSSLASRVKLDEVAKLGTLLQQTEELGSSVAATLRTYSEEMRARRMLKAEEKAHALPAKLVLPLAMFIFPVILVVVFLPVIVRARGIFG